MRDISASGSFKALAEAIKLNGLAKPRCGMGSPTVFAPSRQAFKDLFPEAVTVIAAH
jgi:uncharacterized surface protein with fasciclin (FAS1) repeats